MSDTRRVTVAGTSVLVPANAKSVEFEVRATRCGCGDPDSHSGRVGCVCDGTREHVNGKCPGREGGCPTPLPFDPLLDLRTLYWHRERMKRLERAIADVAKRPDISTLSRAARVRLLVTAVREAW